MAQKLAFRPFRAIQYRILRRSQFRRIFLFALQAGSPLMRSLLASLTLLAVAMAAPVAAAQRVALFIDVSKPGPKIDRNLFGQFAEHLGHGVYEGIWVGPDSKIPNTRGIRNDVVAAQSDKSAERALARRVLRRRIPLAQRHRSAANGNTQSQLGRRHRAEHLRDNRIHGLPRPDWRRGLPFRQRRLRHSTRSS